MGKMLGAWSKDYLRSFIISIIAAAVVIPLGCLLIFVPLGIVQNSNLGDTETLLLLVAPMSLFFILIVGGSLAAGYLVIRRRGHWLDEALAPLGLEGKGYAMNGRQYHGTYQGRSVDILFYRGPTFSLFVGTPLKTRLSVGDRNKTGLTIGRALKREPLVTSSPLLADLAVYADEEGWGQNLISQPEVPEILNRLITGESDFLLHQVHLYPEAFLFRLYRNKGLFEFKIRPEQFQSWLSDLLRLAEIAERLPAPQQQLEISKLERVARTGEASKWGFWIVVGIMLFLFLCLVLPMSAAMVAVILGG